MNIFSGELEVQKFSNDDRIAIDFVVRKERT